MWSAVDSVGIEMQPIRDYKPYWVIYFIFFIICGNFFLVNVFVGVIIDNFERVKSE